MPRHRFNQIPPNTGIGLEMKVIAAVVIGGTSITGGRGTIFGTLLGVILLAAIGPALTFLGLSAYWERAVQGAIILMAVAMDALSSRAEAYATQLILVKPGTPLSSTSRMGRPGKWSGDRPWVGR